MGKRYVYRIICITISMISISSFAIGNEVADNFSNRGYKPVADTCHYVEDGENLSDNFPYKEWCEETFDNGKYIYEAYKDIAFDIEYIPEVSNTDFWQTPTETARLNKGDCEDAVFLFFSQLPPNQENAEIVWGWVINKQSKIGRAHVWYQLIDKKGQQYIVEGFSNDWNGIIPIEIIEEAELRRPIFTMAHSTVGKLANSFAGADDQEIYQSLIDLLVTVDFIDANMKDGYTAYHGYTTMRQMLPDVNKEISNILKKLHELFSRCEKEKKESK